MYILHRISDQKSTAIPTQRVYRLSDMYHLIEHKQLIPEHLCQLNMKVLNHVQKPLMEL